MVAYKQQPNAVGEHLVLRHKDSLIYKYGCSDAPFSQSWVGMPPAIVGVLSQGATKKMGLKRYSTLGRSNIQNNGSLFLFKERWGCTTLRH